MDNYKIRRNRRWYGVATLVLVLGCLAAAMIVISTLSAYPYLIPEAYKSPRQNVEVPGAVDIVLSRKGAYAVYYEEYISDEKAAQRPPNLDCQLTSKMTGKNNPLVPDYVPTNQYMTKDDRVGVLIYSTTIENPGLHTFSCDYPDGRMDPKLVLAIGPNYFFEFFRVVWNMGVSIIGGAGVLCGSILLSIVIVLLAFIGTRKKANSEDGLITS